MYSYYGTMYNNQSKYNNINRKYFERPSSSKRYKNNSQNKIPSQKYPNNFYNNNNNINYNNYYNNSKTLYGNTNKTKKEKYGNSYSQSSTNFYRNKLEQRENLNNLNIYTNNINPKGLDNIGATCYMNATLQCFYHCKKLTKYFLDNKHLQDGINIKNNTITAEYINLVKELSKKDGKSSYAPYRFKEILSRENPLFKGIAANDSKDLILFLEQVLHKELTLPELNIMSRKNKTFQPIDQTNENNVFNLFMNDFKEERSIMKDLFYFICKTKSNCLVCKNIVYNFQVNNFLIFPIEKTYYDSINQSNNNISVNNFNNQMINSLFYNTMQNMNLMNMYQMMYFNQPNMYQTMNMNNMLGRNTMYMNNNNNNNIYNHKRSMSHDAANYNMLNSFTSKSNYNLKNNINQNYKLNNYINNNYNNNNYFKNQFNSRPVIGNNIQSQNKNNNNINLFRSKNTKERKNNKDNNYHYLRPYFLGSGPNDNSLASNKKPKLKVTLDQCFQSYLKPELLSGDNQQYCNKCHRLNNAYYTNSIYSTSNILILILNYGKGVLFECDVDFDEKINISKYVEKSNGPVNYRLLGIIVHIGPSSMSGHFIAYCRGIEDKNQWYKLNDAMVSKASFSEIKSVGMPYVLFYENINPY